MRVSKWWFLSLLIVLLASCEAGTSVDPKAAESADKYFKAVVSSDFDAMWSCYSSSYKDKFLAFHSTEEKVKEFILSCRRTLIMSPDSSSGNLHAGGLYQPGDTENESKRTKQDGHHAISGESAFARCSRQRGRRSARPPAGTMIGA